jgi:hypothetical protein
MRYRFVAHLRVALIAFVAAAVSLSVLTAGASAATYNVKNTAELEAAVVSANGSSGANTIVLASGSYVPVKTLTLTNTSGVQTIEGPTSAPSVRGSTAIVSGSSVEPFPSQLLIVNLSVSATIKNLEIGASGGLGTSAIEDFGNLTIESTTLEGNIGSGVLVTDKGTLTARNSTISEDTEFGVLVDGTASFFNSTIAFNSDGGIQTVGTLNLTNTIVAENTGKGDCAGAATTSDHSLDSDGSCGVGALSKTNPLLQSSLLNNGGTTPVHSLKPGSPAIGAGDESQCPLTDQRGAKRANPCSIGAVEFGAAPTITVPSNITTPATSGSGAVVSYTATAAASEELLKSFSCTPASGSTFPIGTTEVKCTAVAGDENTATASFKVQVTTPKHTLTVTVTGEGTVTSTPAGIDCGQGHTPCSAEFEEVAVTLTSTPAAGYTLSAWGGACSGAGSCSINPLSANESVTAEFSAAPVPPAGGITIGGTPHVGETLSITKGGKAAEWTGAPEGLTYQWEDCNAAATECSAIEGATGNEYTLTALDAGFYVRVSVTGKNASGSTTAHSPVSVKVEMVHSFPVGVHGEVPFTQTLTSYCTEVNLGHFIPAEAKTYTNTCNVTATDTDAASRLTAEDASATDTGHLVQGIYDLPDLLEVQASAEERGSTTGVQTLATSLGHPQTLLNFAEPFADNLLTVKFTQKIGKKDPLHTGVYAKTITLTLSTTTP